MPVQADFLLSFVLSDMRVRHARVPPNVFFVPDLVLPAALLQESPEIAVFRIFAEDLCAAHLKALHELSIIVFDPIDELG